MPVLLRSTFLFAAIALATSIGATAQTAHAHNLTGNYAAGKAAFPRYCNGCHGVRGDGKGTLAPYLDPKPRDYTLGVFKCRSTPTGTLPTDEDIYDTMTRGFVTAAMPPWAPLPPQTRIDIVAYLKGFSPRFANEQPGIPITIPSEPEVTIDSIRRGKSLYQKLECARCHGASGHGNGPDAPKLVNMKNELLPPYDFTATERFKCGETNRDLYRTFMTGLDGTSMPSYIDKLSPDEAWDMVHFVRTLQVAHKGAENKVLDAAGGLKTTALKKP